jgi:glyoxylase-like metal-dependent hydrolase (beta-lactamase superfamily II)
MFQGTGHAHRPVADVLRIAIDGSEGGAAVGGRGAMPLPDRNVQPVPGYESIRSSNGFVVALLATLCRVAIRSNVERKSEMDVASGLGETARATAPVASSTLSVNVFTAPGKAMVGERPKPFGEALGFDPITSTLIFGEHDAVLVDAMMTVAEAEALADWVALHNRNLETIYITHAHFDHFYGLSVLLDRFPDARAIATPTTVNAMQMFLSPPVVQLARRMFPGQVATRLVAPEPYERDTFTLEGHELRILEEGRTDSVDSTSLYVPSIGLIVAGDVVYNQCRMYVGDTTPESRKNWIADLDRLAALNPTMVVAGHKKPGAPDSPSAIQDTKRYLEDFDRLQKTATSDQELFDQMTALYPGWVANQSWLMFGFPGV